MMVTVSNTATLAGCALFTEAISFATESNIRSMPPLTATIIPTAKAKLARRFVVVEVANIFFSKFGATAA